jgi:hypothetical protein
LIVVITASPDYQMGHFHDPFAGVK